MREILFRGKRIDKGEWVDGYFADMGDKACIIKSYEPYWDENYKMLRCLPSETIPVDLSTIGQFTGDKEFSYDANGNTMGGKEIFDGDILEIVSKEDGNGIYLVFWNDEIGGWDWKHLSGAKPSEDYVDEIKVIGNRWDNPELISGKGIKEQSEVE